jgi:hypothetical protein
MSNNKQTPIQELIESITLLDSKDHIVLIPTISKAEIESLLNKEKEFITNFAMDYIFSGEVGCAIYADGPAELDIEKSARDYYNEIFNTKEK